MSTLLQFIGVMLAMAVFFVVVSAFSGPMMGLFAVGVVTFGVLMERNRQ